MNRVKIIAIVATFLLMSNLALLAFIFIRKPRTHEEPKKIIMERLCFDEQQRTEYEKLIQEHRKSIREAQDSMILLKNQLYSTLKSNADASNRNKIITVLGDLQKKIENIHYYHFQAIKSLCKPEQHIKFDSLCSDITGLFPQRGQKHPNEK